MGNFIHIAPENKALGVHIIHSPHLLASLHLLGASPARLAQVYANESKILPPPPPPPPQHTITSANWRAHLGDRAFTQSYLAFFSHELATTHRGDWRALLATYLLRGPAPLVHALTGDLCHPLIHLGYAYELRSADLATDALAYCAVHYDPATETHLNARAAVAKAATAPPARSPLEVFARIRADARLDGFPPEGGPGRKHFAPLFAQHGHVVLEHWAAWPPPPPPAGDDDDDFDENEQPSVTAARLCEAWDACVGLLVGTTPAGAHYDFILLHALTGCYALRVLLLGLPPRYHAALFHQWWLFTLMVYITQGRPEIDDELIAGYALDGAKDWSTPVRLATESPAGFDAHYVKAIRAIKSASEFSAQIGSPRHADEWYLKAATRFAETFTSYRGFDPVDEDMIQQLMALTGQGSSERH